MKTYVLPFTQRGHTLSRWEPACSLQDHGRDLMDTYAFLKIKPVFMSIATSFSDEPHSNTGKYQNFKQQLHTTILEVDKENVTVKRDKLAQHFGCIQVLIQLIFCQITKISICIKSKDSFNCSTGFMNLNEHHMVIFWRKIQNLYFLITVTSVM